MRTFDSRNSLVVLGLKWMVILAILLVAAFTVKAEQIITHVLGP